VIQSRTNKVLTSNCCRFALLASMKIVYILAKTESYRTRGVQENAMKALSSALRLTPLSGSRPAVLLLGLIENELGMGTT
jgi:hypothetical protein